MSQYRCTHATVNQYKYTYSPGSQYTELLVYQPCSVYSQLVVSHEHVTDTADRQYGVRTGLLTHT